MSEDVPGKREMKEFDKIVNFTPLEHQSRVKSKFYRRLEELSHMYDVRHAVTNPQLLEDLAGTKRIHKWMQNPGFRAWFLDDHYFNDTMEYLKEKCPEVLMKILEAEDEEVDAKTKLGAVRLVYEQQGAFPSKQVDVKFLDQEVEKMPEHVAKAEFAKLQEEFKDVDLSEEEMRELGLTDPTPGENVESLEEGSEE